MEMYVRDSYESLVSCLLFYHLNRQDRREVIMPRGDKDKYTDKQKRKAEHIEEGYKERGVSEDEAERRAWATVNAMHHGGEKPGGGGYGKPENREPARKGGRKGGRH
jgi:plasmid stabilization system protein ParE